MMDCREVSVLIDDHCSGECHAGPCVGGVRRRLEHIQSIQLQVDPW